MKKKIMSILCVGAMLVYTACGATTTGANAGEVELIESASDTPNLIAVTYEDIEDMTILEGEVTPYVELLQFPESGSFGAYQVNMGDTVTKGQVLAVTENNMEKEIDAQKDYITTLEINYEDTLANYDLSIHNNNWKAGQKKAIMLSMDETMPGFDDICIAYEMQAAESGRLEMQKRHYMAEMELEITYQRELLEDMENKISRNVITAPIDGTVMYLADVKVGDALPDDFNAMAIADTSKNYVICKYMTEAEVESYEYLYAVKNGEIIELSYYRLDDDVYTEKKARGEAIYTYFEMPGKQIQPGEDVRIFAVKDSRKSVLAVPTACVRKDADKSFVYCYIDGNKQSVEVQTGLSDKLYTEIISGLEEGDYVYGAN